MSAVTSPAIRARDYVLVQVETALADYLAPDADPIPVSDDAGAFHPAPLGVLVGLPTLQGRGLASRSYLVPVHVVSADPLNTRGATDALYRLADRLVVALPVSTYVPTDWSGGVNRDPLPSVNFGIVVTITEEAPDAAD